MKLLKILGVVGALGVLAACTSDLQRIRTTEPSGGTPFTQALTKEYRVFFLHGRPIYTIQYWDEGEYGITTPPIEQFAEVAERVRSNFFTMGIARRKDGGWIIVELGDAQVAGLPEAADLSRLYSSLALGIRSE